MGLELYSKIEECLDIEEETVRLHKEFLAIIFEKDLDNILDVGCGKGAFLNHLKANAKTAAGIDLSVEQIKVCQAFNLDAKTMAIKEVSTKYDCITAIFDVINYIPDTQLQDFFKDAASILNPKAYLLFDANSLFGFEEVAEGSLNIKTDDKFISIDAFFENKQLKTQITVFNKEKKDMYKKEEDTVTQYYHDVNTLKSTLTSAGFEIENVMNLYLYSDEEADKLIFVCKKN